MATRIERRHYHTLEDWRSIYSERYDEGPITHQWLVDSKLCKTPEAARTQTSRHVKAGILYRKNTGSIQTYGLLTNSQNPNNVTGYSITRNEPMPEDAIGGTVPIILSVNGGQIVQSPPNNEPSLCNANQAKRDNSTPRVTAYRLRQKWAATHCTCSDDRVCDYCYYVRFTPVTADKALRLHRSDIPYRARLHDGSRVRAYPLYKLLGELGERLKHADRRILDLLYNIPAAVDVLGHDFAFLLQLPALPPAEWFEDNPRHNHMYEWSQDVNGVNVDFLLYPTGMMEIQPTLTESPLHESALPDFMRAIKESLSIPTPPIEEWDIRCADTNIIDQDVSGQSWVKTFKLPIFDFEGHKVHVYTKRYAGKTWLRIELMKEHPDCRIAEYPRFVAMAKATLLKVMGK